MTQQITVQPSELGTAKVVVTATDEDDTALVFGDLVAPKWQLMRTDGTVVNDRTFALGTLTSLTWALTTNDLAIFGTTDSGDRVLSFQASYTSDLGAGLPLKGECRFTIHKLLGQVDQ